MTDLAHIIERLEKATEPDWGLGEEVLLACGWQADSNDEGEITAWYDPRGCQYGAAPFDLPNPTASIDAALTLVPEGWRAILYTENGTAELYPITPPDKRPFGIRARASDHPLPISICIAALKARQP